MIFKKHLSFLQQLTAMEGDLEAISKPFSKTKTKG